MAGKHQLFDAALKVFRERERERTITPHPWPFLACNKFFSWYRDSLNNETKPRMDIINKIKEMLGF